MSSAFGGGHTGVPPADMPSASVRAGRQVKLLIMGKQPQACADRPPGAQAGGLPTREGPGVCTLGTGNHWDGGRGVM